VRPCTYDLILDTHNDNYFFLSHSIPLQSICFSFSAIQFNEFGEGELEALHRAKSSHTYGAKGHVKVYYLQSGGYDGGRGIKTS